MKVPVKDGKLFIHTAGGVVLDGKGTEVGVAGLDRGDHGGEARLRERPVGWKEGEAGLVAEGARLALIGDGRSGHAMRAPMEPMIVAKPGKLVPSMPAASNDTGCSIARPMTRKLLRSEAHTSELQPLMVTTYRPLFSRPSAFPSLDGGDHGGEVRLRGLPLGWKDGEAGRVAEGARLARIVDGRSGHAMRATMEPMIVAKPG